MAEWCSLSVGIDCISPWLILENFSKQVRQVSMTNILGRVGPILKRRDGADGFSRLLPVLPSVGLWLCQCTLCFK